MIGKQNTTKLWASSKETKIYKKNGEESALKPSLPRSIPNRLYSD